MLQKACELLSIIESNHFKAYIVGGFVRDYCLGIPSYDVDICTNATPQELIKIFDLEANPTNEYGAISIKYKQVRFEITTFRHEIKYHDYRHPDKIVYIDDLYHDLLRRDFTINTLCMTKDGAIIDLLDGKKDLNERIIRVVGDANIKLSEDLLRIMRAIRFATTLNFNLDTSTRACILKYAPLLKKLSYERKKEELNKIFLSPNNQYGIKLMLELGLDQSLDIPNLKKVDVYDDISALWTILDVDDLYPFSHNEKKQMKLIREIAKHDPLEPYSLYQNGLYLSILAGMLNHIDKTKITQQYESLPIKTSHDLAITSDKICDTLNKKPGPWLKLMLEDITKKIINGYIKNEQTAIIKYIMSI